MGGVAARLRTPLARRRPRPSSPRPSAAAEAAEEAGDQHLQKLLGLVQRPRVPRTGVPHCAPLSTPPQPLVGAGGGGRREGGGGG
eukprot:2149529-Pyramimonas_sp.AAC.1